MKIVITGGLGFVGRNLGLHLRRVAQSASLHCIDWATDSSANDREIFDTTTQACFASPCAKNVYRNADIVVHLAATTTVQESVADPTNSFDNNVTKTLTLLEHLRAVSAKAHVIFASTGGAIIGEYDGAINEGIPPRPVSPYGASKLAVEGLLSAYHGSYGLSSTSLRFSNVYGPKSEHKTSVVATFCRNLIASGHLKINGDGSQTRDYIYVDDVCQAIWKAIQCRAIGPFQLGTGNRTSLTQLIEILTGCDPSAKISVSYGPALPGEVHHNQCDISRARTELGFEPEYDLHRGLNATLTWFREAQRC